MDIDELDICRLLVRGLMALSGIILIHKKGDIIGTRGRGTYGLYPLTPLEKNIYISQRINVCLFLIGSGLNLAHVFFISWVKILV